MTDTEWQRLGSRYWQDAHGYRVAAAHVAGVIHYCAFGPCVPYEQFRETLKARYARGERIPQQCEPLGVFDTAEAARQACADHRAEALPA